MKFNMMKVASFAAVSILSFSFTNLHAAHKPVEISGFADAQLQWKNYKPGSTGNSDGFVLNDGALYLTSEAGQAKFMLDIPFAYDGTAGANNIKIGQDNKTQAYITYNCANYKLATTFGQFDTIYGFEANDSWDVTYTRQGLLWNAGHLPTTHTGVMIAASPELGFGSVSVKALAANSANQGKKFAKNFQYGGQLGFSNDMLHANAGYLYFDNGAKAQHLINLMAGASVNIVSADLEVDFYKQGVTGAKWAQAYLLNLVGKVHEKVSLGARGEYTKKMAGFGHKAYQITVGPQFPINDALKLKADYTYANTKDITGAKIKSNQIALAALYHF